jgi:hypothetical protein
LVAWIDGDALAHEVQQRGRIDDVSGHAAQYIERTRPTPGRSAMMPHVTRGDPNGVST